MRLPVDGQFLHEVERFGLCFTCESCLHYLPARRLCGNAWPTDDHMRLPEAGGAVVFCKEFEVV